MSTDLNIGLYLSLSPGGLGDQLVQSTSYIFVTPLLGTRTERILNLRRFTMQETTFYTRCTGALREGCEQIFIHKPFYE